jgi:cyclic pyranopterin phosphate synthase
MAAKRAAELIPLCHPAAADPCWRGTEVGEGEVTILASAETTAQTGVEMEALTAASVRSDRLRHGKAVDKELEITGVRLVEKTKSRREGRGSHGLGRRLRGRARRRKRRPVGRAAWAEGYEVERRVVPDDREAIADAIVELAEEAELVLTTGGTGLGPRDVTPEASAEVIDRPAPGIAEAIRADSIAKTPHGLLSRGIAGVRDRTLVVNLPGSPGGCRDGFAVLQPALRHALELLAGEQTAHRQT